MNSVISGARAARAMVRRGGNGGMKRWAPPSAAEIRELRHSMKLTQVEFADRFNFDLRSLQHWEQGIHEPEQVTAMLLDIIKEDEGVVEKLINKARTRCLERG